MKDSARPPATDRAPLTPETLRNILRSAVIEHPAIADARARSSIHMDRINLDVEDTTGLVWRVAIMTMPRDAS